MLDTPMTTKQSNYLPINLTTFPREADNTHFLGDECHQQVDAAIPVWVLTDMLGNIVVGNAFNMSFGTDNKPIFSFSSKTDKLTDPQLSWCVTRGRITINRSYQSSTATITLSCIRHNMSDIMPSLPSRVARFTTKEGKSVVDYLDKDKERSLDKQDVLCIWAGYLPELRPVTEADLESGKFIRRFVGKIDTIVGLSTFNQGEQVVINMRDFMAYLMDSMGTYNVSDFNPIGKLGDVASVKRHDVILELARRCIGHLENAESLKDSTLKKYCASVGGMKIEQGFVSDFSTEDQSNHTDSIYAVYKNEKGDSALTVANTEAVKYKDGELYKKDDPVPFIGGVTRTPNKELPMGPQLRMNIVTGRAPFTLSGDNTNWLGNGTQITDRVPVEFIKMLSLQEPWPTEFFVDSRTGEYWYAPRGLDTTGLKDPKRFFRTYCVRRQPTAFLSTLIGLGNTVSTDVIDSKLSSSDGVKVTDKDNVQYSFTNDFVSKLLNIEDSATTQFSADAKQEEFLIKYGGGSASPETYSSAYMGLKDLVNKRNDLQAKGKDVSAENEQIIAIHKTIATNAVGKIKELVKKDILSVPKDKRDVIHLCQAALLFREESSVINFRTNVIVSSQPLASTAGEAIGVHVAVHPSWLADTRYACSYFQAVDSTIGSNSAELIATAMSYARYYGKELRAASLHIIGDPSIVPGEAIQVIGSTLYEGGYDNVGDIPRWEWDRQAIDDYIDGYDELGQQQKANAKNDTVASAQSNGSAKTGEGGAANSSTDDTTVVDGKVFNTSTPDKFVKGLKEEIKSIPKNVQTFTGDTFKQMTQAQLMCPYIAGDSGVTDAVDKVKASNDTSSSSIDSQIQNSENRQASTTPSETTTEGAGIDKSDNNKVNFPDDPRTIWRVEAVIEKFWENPGEGYKTEVALISPF